MIISTYNEDGSVDAMNAAWGGVGDDHQVFLCLSKEHKTVKNLLRTKAFCVHIADESLVSESDFFGVVSANDDPDSCHCFGDIINTSVDERVLTDNRIDISKLRPIAFDIDNGRYVKVGPSICSAFNNVKTELISM